MKYGIAVFPSKKLQDIANSYRKRYDTKYAKVPPHLTLKSAFVMNEEEIAKVTQEIREIARESSPFALNVYKYSSFHPVTSTIYMKVKENPQLLSLYEKLNKDNLETPREHPFVPHITVGQDMNDDELSDVMGRLELESIIHEETIDRFSLLYELENGTWTVRETFLLGNNE